MSQIGQPYKRGIGEPAEEPAKGVPIEIPQKPSKKAPIPVELPQREKVKVPAEAG